MSASTLRIRGCSIRPPTEAASVLSVVGGLSEGLSHEGRAGDHAVDAGVLHHVDDGAHPSTGISEPLSPGPVESTSLEAFDRSPSYA